MKKGNRKTALALGLVAGVGVLSIAYAALSSTLNINNTGSQVKAGSVEFKSSNPVAIGSDSVDSKVETTEWNKSTALGATGPNAAQIESKEKNNDTITFEGTELYDFGAYVIYKMHLKNTAPNALCLKTLPEITLKNENDNQDESIIGQINVKLYTDVNCTTPLTVCAADSHTGSEDNSANYLKPDGETDWYLKVAHNKQVTDEGVSTIVLQSGKFGFSVSPVWEAATPGL